MVIRWSKQAIESLRNISASINLRLGLIQPVELSGRFETKHAIYLSFQKWEVVKS